MSEKQDWRIRRGEARGRCQGFMIQARESTLEEFNEIAVTRQKEIGIILEEQDNAEDEDQSVVLITGRKPGARLIHQAWTPENSPTEKATLAGFARTVTPSEIIDIHRSFFTGVEFDVWTQTADSLKATVGEYSVTVRMAPMDPMMDNPPQLQAEEPVNGPGLVLNQGVPEPGRLVYILGLKAEGNPPMIARLLPRNVPGNPQDLAGLAQRLLPQDIISTMLRALDEAKQQTQEVQQ